MTIRTFRAKTLALALPLAGLCCFGCWDYDDDDILGEGGNGRVDRAVATMRGYSDTAITGTVRFQESGDSLVVTAAIGGLLPNRAYGIHVHEVGNCTAPDLSGPHFDADEPHGNPLDSGLHHRGDLPNLVTDTAGVGHLSFATRLIDLETVDRSVVNRSVVLHALPDDYVTQPAGGTGDRIACGVIVWTNGFVDTTGRGGGDTTGRDYD
jgi:superoxide dismutase, Cu-Zn family